MDDGKQRDGFGDERRNGIDPAAYATRRRSRIGSYRLRRR
jgi:hypothetical protein